MRAIVAYRLGVLHTKGTLSGPWLTRYLACPAGHRVRTLTPRTLIDGTCEITLPDPDLDDEGAQDARNEAANACEALNLSMDICGYDIRTMDN